ncbi:TadE/TadG family type IV pilus assembly protein [Alcaligenes phenolicus]|uniref:Pilus assembly protein n=1 Tax=Alcaligenes phenolicus TaxID=232846 RepID=A0AAW5VJN8_9BURK|nr:TadE/TadG family type IV pilus assembly protein [Alcaligenes phenolicus]MCX5564218.1 pilus assembly protein [Alcaligenes phenolicus]
MTRAARFLPAAQRQQGVAAIEFALMVGILLLILSGIIVFSSLFLVQQKMTHLVGDLARQVTSGAVADQEIDDLLNSYGSGGENADRFLNGFGDLSVGFAPKECNAPTGYKCAELSLLLKLQAGILSETMDLLASDQEQADPENQLRSLSAKTLLVLRRPTQ